MNDDNLRNFTETERKGLLGKIIKYFNTKQSFGYRGLHHSSPDFTMKTLEKSFTRKELNIMYEKMMECEEPHSVIESIPFTYFKKERILDYLTKWRVKYFRYEDMSEFLCGLVGNIRRRRQEAVSNALNKIEKHTNRDVTGVIKEYIGPKGGKLKRKTRKNKHRKYKKNVSNKQKNGN